MAAVVLAVAAIFAAEGADPLAFLAQPLGWATVVGVLGLLIVGPIRLKREVEREVEARIAAEEIRDQAIANATRWQEAHAAEVEARQFAERAGYRMMEGESLTMKVLDALTEARKGKG